MRRPRLTDLATWPLPYVTPPELAGYLPCDTRTILRMIEQDALHAVRVGRRWFIPINEARRKFHAEHTSNNT